MLTLLTLTLVGVVSMHARDAVAPASTSSGGGTPSGGGRLLQGAVAPEVSSGIWVNVTESVTTEEMVLIDSYPGGERDLCFHLAAFEIPAEDTTYVCRGFALPPGVPLHALEFEVLADNPAYLHRE